ncbi:NAD-dependent epimerase/dehydratase family protein [candidate division KSB1 bacterium]|nr:NAD-dependent epimerase/dehydratase family protein [candidate division KSB1 bacterium]
MKILVTGGAGFIASHVADAYIKAGHEVVIIDNLSTGKIENINPNAKFYQLDILDEKVKEVFRTEKFDLVNHHAAQMDIRKSVADPLYDARVNILGTLNLMQNSVDFNVKKFIFISSGGAAYGEQEIFPAPETHPTRPLSPYGVTKLTGEKYLYFYHTAYGLQYNVLRYANVYGPRQSPHGEAGVVAIFTTRLLNGEAPVINGDGKQTRDYVYVGDVVRANVKLLDFNQNETFNIGTSIETDVNQIFHHLNSLCDSNKPEQHGPAKKGEQLRSVIDYGKAIQVLDWKPEMDLATGLKETVEFFKQKK